MSYNLLHKVTETDRKAVNLKQTDSTSVKTSVEKLLRKAQAEIKLNLVHRNFVENILVFSTTNSINLVYPFFVKHDFSISPKQSHIQFPDLTVQIN